MKGGIDSSLKGVRVGETLVPNSGGKINQTPGGAEFKQTLDRLNPAAKLPKAELASSVANSGVKFSNHAVERMMHRGIRYSPEDVEKLNQAVAKADSKGAKDTLVFLNDSALIVSVKNKTVVTVMDKNALKENVFTNIDSTVVI